MEQEQRHFCQLANEISETNPETATNIIRSLTGNTIT